MNAKTTVKEIDMATWRRKDIFYNFYGKDLPYLIITAELDVTNLYAFVKENSLSFYFALVYLSAKTADSIVNFRWRFEGEQIFEIGQNAMFATYLNKGDEDFFMLDCLRRDTMTDFCAANYALAKASDHGDALPFIRKRHDGIGFTCLPWINYTQCFRTIAKNGVDCNPKITWGKFVKRDGRIFVSYSVQTHHALMDGYHIGRFYELLQSSIDSSDWN